jgi:hypothetical protein
MTGKQTVMGIKNRKAAVVVVCPKQETTRSNFLSTFTDDVTVKRKKKKPE